VKRDPLPKPEAWLDEYVDIVRAGAARVRLKSSWGFVEAEHAHVLKLYWEDLVLGLKAQNEVADDPIAKAIREGIRLQRLSDVNPEVVAMTAAHMRRKGEFFVERLVYLVWETTRAGFNVWRRRYSLHSDDASGPGGDDVYAEVVVAGAKAAGLESSWGMEKEGDAMALEVSWAHLMPSIPSA
jgi:hypothetical protein